MKVIHKLFESELLLVYQIDDKLLVQNKLSYNVAELRGDYDGFFTLHMQYKSGVLFKPGTADIQSGEEVK